MAEEDRSSQQVEFWDHLEELRWALVRALAAVVLAAGVAFAFVDRVIVWLERPLLAVAGTDGAVGVLRVLRPTEAFTASLQVAAILGAVIAGPYWVWELWRFVSPGLTTKERRAAWPALVWGGAFFAGGVAFCYFVVLKACVAFLWQYAVGMKVQPEWTLGSYLSFAATLLVGFGVAFELPVVIAVLARLGLVTSATLAKRRMAAVLTIFIVAAILTPPDVISQCLMAGPMCALYEASIWIAKWMERRRQASAEAIDVTDDAKDVSIDGGTNGYN